jgi:hypothetical protein
MPSARRHATVQGLESAVAQGKLSARDANYVKTIVENVDSRTVGRYRSVTILGSSEHFVTLSAQETGHGMDRAVLMTLPRQSHKNSVRRLGHVRAMLNAVNDARIGSEYASYTWSQGKHEYACLISTYHHGAIPLGNYLRIGKRPAGGLINLVMAVAEQVASIHQAGFSHGALTIANVLVAEDGPRVVGLELCQPLDVQAQDLTVGGVDPFVHSEALRRCDQARAGGPPVSLDERILWDLYGLGH